MDEIRLLEKFSRFVPELLRKQLIEKFFDEVIAEFNQLVKSDTDEEVVWTPSIQRFQGILLFVDISGFTNLSQKLDVDRLRNFINAYFAKLIDIIRIFGGDTIKFAGDALFVVWPIAADIHDVENYQAEARTAVLSVVNCAVMILRECSHYEVDISRDVGNRKMSVTKRVNLNDSSAMFEESISMQSAKYQSTSAASPSPATGDGSSETANTTGLAPPADAASSSSFFLDVHVGISMGLFGGVDVGYDDRCEYFLIGQPLSDAADAEGEAEKGEIVMSDKVHSYYHYEHCGSVCTCDLLKNGFYKMPQDYNNHNFGGSYDSGNSLVNNDNGQEGQFPFPTAAEEAYQFIYCETLAKDITMAVKYGRAASPFLCAEDLLPVLQTTLIDEMYRHVHHVIRGVYEVKNNRRSSSIYYNHAAMNINLDHIMATPRTMLTASEQKTTNFVDRLRNANTISHISAPRSGNTSATNNANVKSLKSLDSSNIDHSMDIAELREVIVMFISLTITNSNLWVDEKKGNNNKSTFTTPTKGDVNNSNASPEHSPVQQQQPQQRQKSQKQQKRSLFFLHRSFEETQHDVDKLATFENAYHAIVHELHNAGGQLRQFIVDDKGTVAIGTFGLRGSTTLDNAAAAVDCAINILVGLKQVEIDASIGITSGKVYCGLVGGPIRHEFAVMGPSVNLSARLMGKAPMHTILCDETIKSNDRVHNFTHFADIKAKGYDLPVRTFKPLIDREDMFSSTNMGHINGMITSPSKHSKTLSVSSGMLNHEQRKFLRGRENELILVASHLQSFARYYSLLQEIIVEGPINLNVLAAHVHQPMFDLDISCKVINITGHEGIGRRYFLSTIFDRMALDNSCHCYAYWNIILHSVHVSRVRLNEPFACFRKLLVSILSEYTEWALKSFIESNINDSNELHFSLSEIRSNRAKSLKGLDLLLKRLPKDVAMRRPLLSMLGKHYEIPENEVTRGLQGNDRMMALEEFLFTLIQGYQQITQRLLCLNMGNLAMMDDATIRLFMRLFKSSKGIVMAVFMPKDTFRRSSTGSLEWSNTLAMAIQQLQETVYANATVSSDSNDVGNDAELIASTHSSYKQANSNEVNKVQYLEISLPELPQESIQQLVSDYLIDEILSEQTRNKIAEQVFRSTGGNPLYACELTKVLGGHYLALEAANGSNNNNTEGFSPPGATLSSSTGNNSSSTSTKKDLDGLERVEEVVIYRFDMLSVACQNLVKAVAVACAYGADTTLMMLAYMQQGHDLDDDEDKTPKGNKTPVPIKRANSSFRTNNPTKKQQPMPDKRAMLAVYKVLQEVTRTNDFLLQNQVNRVNAVKKASVHNIVTSNDDDDDLSDDFDDTDGDSNYQKGMMKLQSTRDIQLEYLRGMTINFRRDLEQQVVYHLLLEEQRNSLHSLAASYLLLKTSSLMINQRRPTTSYYNPTGDFYLQSLHWEAAGAYASAMQSYCTTGLVAWSSNSSSLSSINQIRAHMMMAYNMMDRMQQVTTTAMNNTSQSIRSRLSSHNGMSSPGSPIVPQQKASNMNGNTLLAFSTKGNQVTTFEQQLQRLIELYDANPQSTGEDDELEQTNNAFPDVIEAQKRNDLKFICDSEVPTLVNWLTVLLHLAQFHGFHSLFSLTSSGTTANLAKNISFHSLLREELVMLIATAPNALLGEEEFILEDVTVLFRYFMLMHYAFLVPDSNVNAIESSKSVSKSSKKESPLPRATASEAFLLIATKLRQSNALLEPHVLVALCQRSQLLFEERKTEESWQLMEQVIRNYDFSSMHTQLASIYHFDHVLLALVLQAQRLAMNGNIAQFHRYLQFVLPLIPQITHEGTLELIVWTLCSLFSFLDRPADGYAICLTLQSSKFIRKKALTFSFFFALMKDAVILMKNVASMQLQRWMKVRGSMVNVKEAALFGDIPITPVILQLHLQPSQPAPAQTQAQGSDQAAVTPQHGLQVIINNKQHQVPSLVPSLLNAIDLKPVDPPISIIEALLRNEHDPLNASPVTRTMLMNCGIGLDCLYGRLLLLHVMDGNNSLDEEGRQKALNTALNLAESQIEDCKHSTFSERFAVCLYTALILKIEVLICIRKRGVFTTQDEEKEILKSQIDTEQECAAFAELHGFYFPLLHLTKIAKRSKMPNMRWHDEKEQIALSHMQAQVNENKELFNLYFK